MPAAFPIGAFGEFAMAFRGSLGDRGYFRVQLMGVFGGRVASRDPGRLAGLFLARVLVAAHHLIAPRMAALARTASTAAPTASGAPVDLGIGSALGALLLLDQRLPVGDRNLVIIGMDFTEGEEAVTVAAVFDESGLKRRLDPRYLREVDIAAELAAGGGLEVEFLDPAAAHHHDPGLLRVGGVDEHLIGH